MDESLMKYIPKAYKKDIVSIERVEKLGTSILSDGIS